MTASLRNQLGKLLKVEPGEIGAAVLSFSFVLILMASYYVLRPVRDAMASDWSDVELSWLWTLNFFISGAAVLVYGWIASRLTPARLVPAVYFFFAASFGLFYLATQTLDDTRLLDKAFYIWVSFFALFHVSVFWSFMSGLYNSAQSKRLFGLFLERRLQLAFRVDADLTGNGEPGRAGPPRAGPRGFGPRPNRA